MPTYVRTFSSSLTISKLSWAISERRSFCSVVSNFGMNFAQTRAIPKILFKISQTVVFGIPRSFSSSQTVNRWSPSITSGTCSMFSSVVVSEGEQRPSVSFQSSSYNSCRDWSKTWCKFVDLFFLSFSTVNKCDERKKHVGHKHMLRATQGVRPVTTAFKEFVRDYWLRSYPGEAARALWREDINAVWILFEHTSYSGQILHYPIVL